ncbi:MAG: S8 family peptidase [Thaumarchaeota archaeon]|nr:S8 family peptidase [Nitrososphaerota archaeon]
MSETYPHLQLRPVGTSERRKRPAGFGYQKAERDHEYFYKATARKLRSLKEEHKKTKAIYSRYLNPNLIFKVTLTKTSTVDNNFRDELRRLGMETISSTSDLHGYWVMLTDDAQFKKLHEKMKKRTLVDQATIIDQIISIDEIKPEEKLGDSLHNQPANDYASEYFDVEIWRMGEPRLTKFEDGLYKLIKDSGGAVHDMMKTESFSVMRVECDGRLLAMIAELREVASIDRPRRVMMIKQLECDVEMLDIQNPPDKNRPGILVVDSGVNNHPLIEAAVADRILVPSSNGMVRRERDTDDAAHGTGIAGIALYGDVSSCMTTKQFHPDVLIYSAKVMYRGEDGTATYDEKSLLEHQLKDSIEGIINKHSNCTIINISFGDESKVIRDGQRQFRIAALIDELSVKHRNIMFAIAAGNQDVSDGNLVNLVQSSNQQIRIIDPATSAYGLTVGSIFVPELNPSNHSSSYLPSQFTRTGPGLNEMVKPELVEYGGAFGSEIATTNPNWLDDGRLLTLVSGTSFTAPLVAHYLAMLKSYFPNASRNLLKALLLSSAVMADDQTLPVTNSTSKVDVQATLSVYGYGKPNLEHAKSSDRNRVLMMYDGEIKPGHFSIFSIQIPEAFSNNGGGEIEVTLVFDPPVNSNRSSYLGVTMEYHLFKDVDTQEVNRLYGEINNSQDDMDGVPPNIRSNEIKMQPGSSIRKKGLHQKSTRWFLRGSSKKIDQLVLAVLCKKVWFEKTDYMQQYSVVVTIKHKLDIDLYNTIRAKNVVRARIR